MLLPSSFFRAGVLRAYAGSVPIVLVGLQAAPLGRIARTAMRLDCPDMVAVSAGMFESTSAELGRARVGVLPTGVVTVRFAPADVETRTCLRAFHGIDPGHAVYLHVGHLNRVRGLEVLQSLAGLPRTTVVVVASNSTPHSTEVVHSLQAAGVRIETRVTAVEDWYRLADCYVFPVRSPVGCIDMPASVLEAMATDLPVVATRFGALPKTFEPRDGFAFVDSADELVREAQRLARAEKPRTRAMVSAMGWLGTADALLELLSHVGEHES
jgi:glycosyltransferase involved in cell wall biosynthesis